FGLIGPPTVVIVVIAQYTPSPKGTPSSAAKPPPPATAVRTASPSAACTPSAEKATRKSGASLNRPASGSSRSNQPLCPKDVRNGGVKTTIARSRGCERRYWVRLGTTASITTSSARNASQISQLRTVPIASHGSPTEVFWRIVAGIVRTAAAISGFSNARR